MTNCRLSALRMRIKRHWQIACRSDRISSIQIIKKDGTPELQTTFYMDSDHLHRMEGNEKAVLR